MEQNILVIPSPYLRDHGGFGVCLLAQYWSCELLRGLYIVWNIRLCKKRIEAYAKKKEVLQVTSKVKAIYSTLQCRFDGIESKQFVNNQIILYGVTMIPDCIRWQNSSGLFS